MARNRDVSHGSTDVRYDNFPISGNEVERTDIQRIGLTGLRGSPTYQFYQPVDRNVFEVETDADKDPIKIKSEAARELTDQSLGEYIESVGDEYDWQWLSEFAQEHLESENAQ